MMKTIKPFKSIGIYIHIPFCLSKCNYCDFLSFKCNKDVQNIYVENLLKEIELWYFDKKIEVDTIYIGGGTPSILDSDLIEKILLKLDKFFNLQNCIETTIEINPKTIEEHKIKDYKNIGINRLSLGIQSTDEKVLKIAGRKYNFEDILKDVDLFKKAGYENISIDMIFGLPEQDMSIIVKDLGNILKLDVSHISYYGLSINENTEFYNLYKLGKLKLPEENIEREMYHTIIKTLGKNNFLQYEISNFSKPGFNSKHNLKYWNCEEYLGLGLGSSSYIGGYRFSNTKNLNKYIDLIDEKKIPAKEFLKLVRKDYLLEYIIMKMRLIEGINLKEFESIFKFNFIDKYRLLINKYLKSGMIKVDGENICFTLKGFDLSNTFLCEFF